MEEIFELSYAGTPSGLMRYIGEQICEDCHGSGVLYFMERDRDGHYAPTGERTCHCQLIHSDWDDQGDER